MKLRKHRDKTLSLTLTQDEADKLWALVREGRRAHSKDASYDHNFAIRLMRLLDPSNAAVGQHIKRFG